MFIFLRNVSLASATQFVRSFIHYLPTRVAALLLWICAEKSRMVALLHDDVRDARAVGGLELKAGLSNAGQLVLQHVLKLSLANAVSVDYDSEWLKAARGPVESHEVFLDHVGEILNYFHSVGLNFD